MTKDLSGMISPLLTPFKNDAVQYDVYEEQAHRLIAAGMDGISPGGSTGEGAALFDEELAEMVKISRNAAGSDKLVVAGVIRNSTAQAIQTAKVARDNGADALMVTPTFYNVLVPDSRGNYEFYERIAEEVNLPIVIYNVVPQNEVTAEDFEKLLEIDQVVGIKQSLKGLHGLYPMRLVSDEALVYAATDEMLASCFTMKANGAISAILSLFPETSVKIWDLVREGKEEEAMRLQEILYPIWMKITGPQFPARMKAATRIMGHDLGESRSPSSPVPEETARQLQEVLQNVSVR